MIDPKENRDPTLNELILSDNETYPMAVSPDAERVWDEEVVPLLTQAHEKAARAGMPIMSAGLFDPKAFGTGVLITVKNMDSLIASFAVCMRLMVGNDPMVPTMMSAAVKASGDGWLAHKFMEQLADALDIPFDGKTPQQLSVEVRDALQRQMDSMPKGPTEVM